MDVVLHFQLAKLIVDRLFVHAQFTIGTFGDFLMGRALLVPLLRGTDEFEQALDTVALGFRTAHFDDVGIELAGLWVYTNVSQARLDDARDTLCVLASRLIREADAGRDLVEADEHFEPPGGHGNGCVLVDTVGAEVDVEVTGNLLRLVGHRRVAGALCAGDVLTEQVRVDGGHDLAGNDVDLLFRELGIDDVRPLGVQLTRIVGLEDVVHRLGILVGVEVVRDREDEVGLRDEHGFKVYLFTNGFALVEAVVLRVRRAGE